MEEYDVLIICFVIALFIVAFFVNRFMEKKRSEQMERVAKALGMKFEKDGNIDFEKVFSDFDLFTRGRSKQLSNRMRGRRNRTEVMVFGYRYTTGSGKHSQTHRQTVLSFESDSMDLPKFDLCPENFMHKIGQVFGYQDIDFKDSPVFSKSYLLRGKDVEAIRRVFSSQVLLFFEESKEFCVEGSGNKLICYKKSKRSKPREIQAFLKKGEQMHQLLT